MIWIGGQTVGSGNAAELEFTNIPQEYTHLQLRIFGRGNTSFSEGLSTYMFINNDGGNNYSWHRMRGNGSSVFSDVGTSVGAISIQATVGDTGVSNVFGVSIIDILDYANTSKNKTIRVIGGVDRNGSGNACLISGSWRSTAAVNQLRVITDSNTWLQGTRIDLYGITSSQVTGA
jgi:hypothetical protein